MKLKSLGYLRTIIQVKRNSFEEVLRELKKQYDFKSKTIRVSDWDGLYKHFEQELKVRQLEAKIDGYNDVLKLIDEYQEVMK